MPDDPGDAELDAPPGGPWSAEFVVEDIDPAIVDLVAGWSGTPMTLVPEDRQRLALATIAVPVLGRPSARMLEDADAVLAWHGGDEAAAREWAVHAYRNRGVRG